MKRTAIIILTTAVIVTATSAKITRRTLGIYESNVPETETLATGTMEFVYDYKWCFDTTEVKSESFDSDHMLLQIAPGGLSKFSSLKNLTVDSILMSATQEQLTSAIIDGKLSNGEFMTIFKNYPEGKLTHTEKICTDRFRYSEDMPALDWELTDSTTTILGYECHSAVCRFRGRTWTAFYCEEIPVPEGPWKLCGLPGLIMKACDTHAHYSFECIGINSHVHRPVTIYKVPYNDTSRQKFYKTKHSWDSNPYGYFEAQGGGHVGVSDEAGNPMPNAYDPMELPYDYIETDLKE